MSSEQVPLNVMSVSSAHTRDPPPADQQNEDQQQTSTPQQVRRFVTIQTNRGDWTFEVSDAPNPTPRQPTPGRTVYIDLQPSTLNRTLNPQPSTLNTRQHPAAQQPGDQGQNQREFIFIFYIARVTIKSMEFHRAPTS